MDNETKIVKHLEMIEAVIHRLATTSSIIKGWMVTIIVAIVSIFHTSTLLIFSISIPITLVLASLDALYLGIERKFRCLYNQVRVKETTDFSMDLPKDKYSYFKALMSPSIVITYLAMILMILIICTILEFALR